ncbi:MAG: thiamine pyrophosphate-dependent enzyme [Planctomycetota bacterium]
MKGKRNRAELLLGNGAIARGLLEAGAEVVTAYPGTPSTEILEEVFRLRDRLGLDVTAQWSVNEKVAFDVALAAAWSGKRAATAMKQVGLNVASDSLLSAAYTGIVGGFVVIACDDPGPYSSQTEQDSRLFALFAKVPVLDPVSPRDAKEMVLAAFELSERHRVPVLLRPTTRICHARQAIVCGPVDPTPRRARFVRDPGRWAATPRFRLELHREVNEKLEAIRAEFERSPLNAGDDGEGTGPLGIIAAGHAWATVRDVLAEEEQSIPVLRIGTPFPLPLERVERFIARHDRVLVLEEPDFAIETQIPDRTRVQGRLSGHVPAQGELTPEVVAGLLGLAGPETPPVPGAPPQLCAACGHRAAFFAMRMALPKAIFCGDIGCYTLGLNQEALDTCLDMGASITLAEGFFHAHRRDGKDVPVVAVIGDSTFFHAGMPGLLNAITSDARIIVVVLDNEVVAMTGAQPTPARQGAAIETIAGALGVRFVETIDPYEIDALKALLKQAHAFTRRPDGGVALVVARRPCALHHPPTEHQPVYVDPALCTGCDICLRFFGCQPLRKDPESGKVFIDESRCIDCAMCIPSCPHHAILPRETEPAR